jgi:hypothetical protein
MQPLQIGDEALIRTLLQLSRCRTIEASQQLGCRPDDLAGCDRHESPRAYACYGFKRRATRTFLLSNGKPHLRGNVPDVDRLAVIDQWLGALDGRTRIFIVVVLQGDGGE